MELNEFIQEFLPDYDKKYAAWIWELDEFLTTHFPAAIQNFTDQICEEQRNRCAHKYEFEYFEDDKFKELIFKEIQNAEQPQIDDILTKK